MVAKFRPPLRYFRPRPPIARIRDKLWCSSPLKRFGMGLYYSNAQRQLNFVDTFSWAVGVHQLKFGIDYRRLSPSAIERDRICSLSGVHRLSGGDYWLRSCSVRPTLFLLRMNNYALFTSGHMEGEESFDTDVWVALGDQYPAGFDQRKPTALRVARTLRHEAHRRGAGSTLAHQVWQFCPSHWSRVSNYRQDGGARWLWPLL